MSRIKPKQTETTLNFWKMPKYDLYQTVSVGLLFVSGQSKRQRSLFRYRIWNNETNCFDTNRNKPKLTETTRNNTKFYDKIPKYALYQTVSVGLLFVSVQSKHRNCLFWYRSETTETNILFRIVPKLVSVSVSGFRMILFRKYTGAFLVKRFSRFSTHSSQIKALYYRH
jgi:hypothetical protein